MFMQQPSSRRAKIFLTTSASLLLLTLFASGCSPLEDQCQIGEARCHPEANAAQNCGTQEDLDGVFLGWSREACYGETVCHVVERGEGDAAAVCVLDAAVDPECPEALRGEENAARCVGAAAVSWSYGHRVNFLPCEGRGSCVDVETPDLPEGCADFFQAICVDLSDPDPRCGVGFSNFCLDDSTLAECSCGAIQSTKKCDGETPVCGQRSGTRSYCLAE